MGEVAPGKFFDAVVYGMLLIVLSGVGLLMFSNFIHFAISHKAAIAPYGDHIPRLFGMKGNHFDFNLTHVLMFAIVIAILSIREPLRAIKEKREKKD